MEKYENDQSKDSAQRKQLQNIARLVDDHYELEKRYVQVLSELDQLKTRMKNLNHDLRSPLGGITGMIDLLVDEQKGKIDVQSSDLIMIKESAQSILDLVNGTLADEKTEKEKTERCTKENTTTDRLLTSAMMEINRLYLPMAQSKDISLSLKTQIDTEVQLPPKFFMNLIQITGNLVANAIKFTQSNGSVEVIFNLENEEKYRTLNMTVSDTGKSMSPEQITAFNNGEPVARSIGTNGEESFGIGLQHVKKMVSDDNGHIDVESENGKGTLFSLSFPLPGNNSPLIDTSHFIVNNGTISHNGYHK